MTIFVVYHFKYLLDQIVSKSHKKIVAYKKKKNMTSEDLAKESQVNLLN